MKELIKAAQDKQLEAEPGRTMMESFENRVNQMSNPFALSTFSVLTALADIYYNACFCPLGFE